MASQDPYDASLDLLRRLDPSKVGQNLENLCKLAPDLTEDLLSSVDQPLKVLQCSQTGRDFLICDYNRDEDSYRSPWSNEYHPSLPDGTKPSPQMRQLEIVANQAFDVYRDLYYEGGISSVYLWDQQDGFAGVVLIKNSLPSRNGFWDAIHVFEVVEKGAQSTSTYKLTSTIILSVNKKNSQELGSLDLSGSLTRQVEQDMPLDTRQQQKVPGAGHIANIGRLVEDIENKMKNQLGQVYFDKAKDIVGDLRSIQSISVERREDEIRKEALSSMTNR